MTTEQLKQLLDSLTLDEKIGQLVQLNAEEFGAGDPIATGPQTGPASIPALSSQEKYRVGAVYNALQAEKIRDIQMDYLRHARHGIPLLFCADIVYGYRTIFPIPLAQGCSWDFESVERCAALSAEETSGAGIHGVFSPMVDLVRDPRWGRVMESPGEDPTLCAAYAAHAVRGLQGTGAEGPVPANHVAACVKHFAAYGAPEAGREYNTVDMSLPRFYGEYLPGYRAGINAGSRMVMTAFHALNGDPCTGNEWLNRTVLRGECGFRGVLVSDYSAIWELVLHGRAAGAQEAAALAMRAGCDLDMMSPCYFRHLKALIETKTVDEALLNEAVMRVLQLKNDLGLFEDPLRGLSGHPSSKSELMQKAKRAAREMAEKSAVLLKNEGGVLPLADGKKIALLGPYAESGDTLGMWAISGRPEDTVTLYDGLKKLCGENVRTACGCYMTDCFSQFGELEQEVRGQEPPQSEEELLAEALAVARSADVIVLALGEHTQQSGEGASRANPVLPAPQMELARRVRRLGKPVAAVLYAGRPLLLRDLLPLADAVLYAWFPGTMGGAALANLLTGKAGPCGRLSITFPRSTGQIPIYHAALTTGRTPPEETPKSRFSSHYLDEENTPLFPFGYGLSYTQFSYRALSLSSSIMLAGESIFASAAVKNTGGTAGWETVQLYLHDEAASLARPRRELKAFKQVWLEPNQEKTVSLEITEDMLAFYHSDLARRAEEGWFTVLVGPNAGDTPLAARFCYAGQRKSGPCL